MAHESIPIAQERQMVKHIKKLRDSRQRVRQYEELYAGVETARAAVRNGQGELKEMLEERQVCPACSLSDPVYCLQTSRCKVASAMKVSMVQ